MIQLINQLAFSVLSLQNSFEHLLDHSRPS